MTELENSWRTASSVLRGRTLVLDLREVSSTDEAGKQLLARMQMEGAYWIPESRVGESILTGVPGKRAAVQGGRVPCRRLLQRLHGLTRASVMGT